MKKIFLAFTITAVCHITYAQSYADSIAAHRQHYKQEFVAEPRSPIKGNDTAYLQFYKADKKYRVIAELKETPTTQPFDMPTSSGKAKKFRQYGLLRFKINGKEQTLQVFQNLQLLNDPKHKDHLFVPFTDGTTYEETYGGGRYIDLATTDVKDGKIVVDFNKCYNPYCAYGGAFNCPIPPVENRMKVSIKAGEKLYSKSH